MPKIPTFTSQSKIQIGNSGAIPVATQSLDQTKTLENIS